MKPFEKFITMTTEYRDILDSYLNLRQHFQELDFSESDLERPPIYSQKMMHLYSHIQKVKNELWNKVLSFGVPMRQGEYDNFLLGKMQKINEITPLIKDGYNKRNNIRDEDN